MEGAEAWVTQPLHYNRSCDFLIATQAQASQAAQLAQKADSFVSTRKGRRAKKRRREEAERLKQGGTALVEVERSTVQSFCK